MQGYLCGRMPNRPVAGALPLHHIPSIILITYFNTEGPVINQMRVKQEFHEFLRKTSMLIDLNFIDR